MTRSAIHRTCLTLSVLAVCLFAWYGMSAGELQEDTTRPGEQGPAVETPAHDSPEPVGAESLTGQRTLSATAVTVFVMDSAGNALPGAIVQAIPASSRIAPQRSHGWSTSDTQGLAVLDLSEGRTAPTAILASLSGFAAGWIPNVEPGEHYTAVLQRANKATFRCRTGDGRSVSGVVITVGASQWRRQGVSSDSLDAVPAGAPEARLHTSVSDANGIAVIDGLVQRRYIVDLHHETSILVSRLPEGGGFQCTGDLEIDLVFQEPMVSAYAFTEEPVITWRKTPHSVRPPHPTFAFTGGVGRSIERSLRKSGSEAGLMVSYSLSAEPPPPLTVFGYFAGSGWATFAVPYSPASRTEVTLLTPPPTTTTTDGSLTVRLIRPDGSRSLVEDVHLSLTKLETPPPTSGGVSVRMPLRVGCRIAQPMRLPAGSYRLVPGHNVLGMKMDNPAFELAAGRDLEHVVTETTPMGMISIDARTEHGHEIDFFAASFRASATGETLHWNRVSAFGGTAFLPAGDYVLTVQCQGFDPIEQHVSVSTDPNAPPVRLALQRSEIR